MTTPWNTMTGITATRLADTKDLSRDEWLAVRRKGIGGSDIAAICGLNPFKSPLDVYLEKTGRVTDTPPNEKMKWGNILEDPVAKEFANRRNCKIQRVNAVLQHHNVPHALVNLDRMIHAAPDPNGVLEVKTTSWASPWANNELPEMYYCQFQWELEVSGLSWGSFAVLISGSEYQDRHEIPRDPAFCNNLLTAADHFWTNYVVPDNPPPPTANDNEAYNILYPEVKHQTVELDPNLKPLLDKRAQLKATHSQLDKQCKFIDAQILGAMQEAKYAVCGDHKITRIRRESLRFNSNSFREDYPELHAKYSTPSVSIFPKYKLNTK